MECMNYENYGLIWKIFPWIVCMVTNITLQYISALMYVYILKTYSVSLFIYRCWLELELACKYSSFFLIFIACIFSLNLGC